MKELVREYQSILITCISCIFVFICVYTLLPGIVNETIANKQCNSSLKFNTENSETFRIRLEYPKGDKIKLVKGNEFDLSDYIIICDNDKGDVINYSYHLNVNGKNKDSFDTNTCGGYYVCADIFYNNCKLQGDLLVIIEER